MLTASPAQATMTKILTDIRSASRGTDLKKVVFCALKKLKLRDVSQKIGVANEMKTASEIEYERSLEKMKHNFDKIWIRKPEPSTPMTGFEIYKTLGSGAFGDVVLVKSKANSKYYAMKVQSKSRLVRTKQVIHTFNEKRILMSIHYPFCVNMEFCFKDANYIYFIMPFINGGDMFTHLRKFKKFKEDHSKFYAAQVALALEYLHYIHLVYRDLKPENILLDNEGYIKITDFGFCKYVKTRTWTLCGTPDYLAPEVILSKGYGQSVDWWAFGVLIYEMSSGFAPFYDKDQMITYEKIVALKYKYPSDFSMELKDLIRNLLQVDLSRRYGVLRRGVYDIKNHMWFKDISWSKIYEKSVEPPFIPDCKDPADTSNFDVYDEVIFEVSSTDKYAREFKDF